MILNKINVDNIIKTALLEDINYIDVTTDLLIPDTESSDFILLAKDNGVLCGIDVAIRVFEILDPNVSVEILLNDGSAVTAGDVIAKISGNTRALLKGERTALNILQHMSGVATYTSKCAALIEGTNASVTDTRKTLPGLRALEKYAVMTGGGRNHRFNLSDGAMIKDNHVDAVGSITQAVEKLREQLGHMVKIEVEVRNLDELQEALNAKADVIMLDNMDTDTMAQAVAITDSAALLEASGNVTEANILEIAQTGIDIISLGALTHSVKAFDISMRIVEK